MKKSIFAILFLLVCAFPSSAQHLRQYLSGTDNVHTKTWDFFCTDGRRSGEWTSIQVPSHWEQQGFGTYNYGRDYKTYGKNFRFAQEKGLYRLKFNVPSGWKGLQVWVVFEGSMTDTEVKINGRSAGAVHQGAFYRFRYDVSGLVSYGGSNLLEATVSKMSADPSVNNAERLADYWILGGIFRPVYLEATPATAIDHTSMDARADGSFSMQVHLNKASLGTEVRTTILDSSHNVLAKLSASAGTDSIVTVKSMVKGVRSWNPENPVLYLICTELFKAGKRIDIVEQKTGFRTIEVRRQDGIYVNGVKVKMKGVNRHVWWPETGRCVNPEIDLADVKLIKGMNMNAVRCSHYPPDQSFLDICDSLGLFVLDELAGWQKAYATPVGEKLVKEMVIRDANHPSIIFWSNGNEGGHNTNLDDDYAKYDYSNRTVIHAHHRPGNAFNGIDCNHYEDFYSTSAILKDTNIYMVTEFLHAQDDGGAASGLRDLWDLHWNSKLGGGGFIWALLDEGLVRTDRNNIIDVNGINAPDGIVGPHREKEGSYNAIREIFCPVQIVSRNKGMIEIENRFHFTNLNQCRFRWQVANYQKPNDVYGGYVVKGGGSIAAPDVKPNGERGVLRFDLPEGNDLLILSAYDRHGLLNTWTWDLKSASSRAETLVAHGAEQAPLVSDTTFTLKGGGITVMLDRKTGFIRSVTNVSSDPLSFGQGPVFVGDSSYLIGSKTEGNSVVFNYSGSMKEARWSMNDSGWLRLDYSYELYGDYPFAGISFKYPENYVLSAKWQGLGPYRVWKNRMQGVTNNVWVSAPNSTVTGAAPWLYPEFKGYFANVGWFQMSTAQGQFTIVTPQDSMYLRLFDFNGLTGPTPFPALPAGDISFLDAIPPIGTKLAFGINTNTAALGPRSEPNHLNGVYHRTLYFYFGTPKPSDDGKQFTMPKVNDLL